VAAVVTPSRLASAAAAGVPGTPSASVPVGFTLAGTDPSPIAPALATGLTIADCGPERPLVRSVCVHLPSESPRHGGLRWRMRWDRHPSGHLNRAALDFVLTLSIEFSFACRCCCGYVSHRIVVVDALCYPNPSLE